MQILHTSFHSPLGKLAAALRVEVFVHEQSVPADEELDHYDANAIHFVALQDDRVVGTLRIVLIQSDNKPVAKIGRVAVAKHLRNQGIGRQLMVAAIEHVRSLGLQKCTLGAQLPVIGFYEKLGFIANGPVFDECGIDHRNMTLELSAHD
jgi:predicted GNAT family N-acyltransferase